MCYGIVQFMEEAIRVEMENCALINNGLLFIMIDWVILFTYFILENSVFKQFSILEKLMLYCSMRQRNNT